MSFVKAFVAHGEHRRPDSPPGRAASRLSLDAKPDTMLKMSGAGR